MRRVKNVIAGERIYLRAIEAEDTERCHQWMNDPEVTRFLGMGFPISLERERKWVEADRDPAQELEVAICASEGRHIGNAGLHRISPIHRNAELGISIGDKEYWGQGYGSDAMLTLCGFGFAYLNLHRIGLSVFPFNTRGIRCYEKCGFQHEGRTREALFKHGQYHDMIIMGLLAAEYQKLWPQRWEALCAPGQTL
jgi:RimJ/RimL family protein N-acetyltransferase